MANSEDNRQPSKFGDGVEYDTIAYVAPYASFGYKMVLGNLWLFKGIVSMVLNLFKVFFTGCGNRICPFFYLTTLRLKTLWQLASVWG